MKSNYKIEPLGEHVKQYSLRNKDEADIEVYSVTNSAGFTLSTDYFSKEVYSKDVSNYKIVSRDQFAYNPSRINVGSIDYLRNKDKVLVSPLYIIFETDSKLSEDYLLRFLKSDWGNIQIRANTEGAVRDSLKFKGLEKIKIPRPPLDDQKRIAHLLGKVEGMIARRKQHLQQLDELLKSVFLEMFGDPVRNEKGWEKKEMRYCAIRMSDGPFGSNLKTVHYEETGIQVIRLNNIGIGEFINKDKAFVGLGHYENVLKKYSCYSGDVVIATMGEPNVRACTVPKSIKVAINKADCVLFKPNKDIVISEYIVGLINSAGFLSLAANLFHGQTRTRVSMGQLAKLFIPIPPITLQNQFAAIAEKAESLKPRYQSSLSNLEKLYGALSQKAFKGELDLGGFLWEI